MTAYCVPAVVVRDEFNGRIALTRREVRNVLHVWDDGPEGINYVRFMYSDEPRLTCSWGRGIAADGNPWLLELQRGEGGGDIATLTLKVIGELRTLICNGLDGSDERHAG